MINVASNATRLAPWFIKELMNPKPDKKVECQIDTSEFDFTHQDFKSMSYKRKRKEK
jgi:hypothetical protein